MLFCALRALHGTVVVILWIGRLATLNTCFSSLLNLKAHIIPRVIANLCPSSQLCQYLSKRFEESDWDTEDARPHYTHPLYHFHTEE